MFFSRRNPRPIGGKKRRGKPQSIRPLLEALEHRITPTTSVNVSTSAELVSAVQTANSDTGGGTYTINLAAGNYSLNTAFSGTGSGLELNNTTDQIILAGAKATNGSPGSTITATGPFRVLEVDAGSNVILDNVALTGGKAFGAGGGLLNNGGNVALTNVNISGNAAAPTFGTAGGGVHSAAGGGIYSTGGALVLDRVTLNGNTATGPSDPNHNSADGDSASGGGLATLSTNVIVTNVAVAPGQNIATVPALTVPFNSSTLTQPLLTVTGNTVQGGNGGNGNNTDTNQVNGGTGGQALGGGLYLDGGTVSIVAATITNNNAVGGTGGNGNPTATAPDFVGTGGDGGSAFGGGVEAGSDTSTTITVQDSTIASNVVTGGGAGVGSSGSGAGAGGNGGIGAGGGLSVGTFAGGSDDFSKPSALLLYNSTVADNSATGAVGGQAGTNTTTGTAGKGGNGGAAYGGGLLIQNGVSSESFVSIFEGVTVAFNSVLAGNGGTGSTAGTQGEAYGAGIATDVEFKELALFNSAVAANVLKGGNTANAGVDVTGELYTNSGFNYIGNPTSPPNNNNSGSFGNNLLSDSALFNAGTQTPLNNNLYGGFNGVSNNPQFIGTAPTNNGGPTATIEIHSTSPLRSGAANDQDAIDQRGVARGSSVDIGAVQLTPTTHSPPPPPPHSPPPPPPPPPAPCNCSSTGSRWRSTYRVRAVCPLLWPMPR